MYFYDEIDQRIVDERVAQFRDQTARYLLAEARLDPLEPVLSIKARVSAVRNLPAGATLQAVLDALLARFPTRLSAPSVSCGRTNLYMRGVFEEETRPNLAKPVAELMGASSGLLVVNDKKLHGPLRVRLTCGEAMDESQP